MTTFNLEETSATNDDETDSVVSYAGIPEAIFVEDVDSFMALSENEGNAEKVIKNLDEQHNKYKFMEVSLMSKRRRLKGQIPDLEQSLEMIEMLQKCKCKGETKEIEAQFLLSEQVYMEATVKPVDSIYLWLGANIMLEYSLEEAAKLLQNNVNGARNSLKRVEHDLDFLRDQFTTTEVNMARVYNWDVKRRQANNANSSK